MQVVKRGANGRLNCYSTVTTQLLYSGTAISWFLARWKISGGKQGVKEENEWTINDVQHVGTIPARKIGVQVARVF